jgi:hypothetical protein
MRVRVLDSKFLLNCDLVDDLLTMAGLDVTPEDIRALERPGQANVPPGWRVLDAVRGFMMARRISPRTIPWRTFRS